MYYILLSLNTPPPVFLLFLPMKHLENDLKSIFLAAIRAVEGKTVVSRALSSDKDGPYHVIAIGKAAESMLQGVPEDKIIDGLLISKHGHISTAIKQDKRFICIESDHPVPSEASLQAGRALLGYLENMPAHEPCLFLISGGTSSLVEVLEEGWTLAELSQLTQYLLENAYSIDEINAVRRQVSKIKGGRLWSFIGSRPVNCLLISDVPNDDPAIIGSGLLFPSSNNVLPELPANWATKLKPIKVLPIPSDFQWQIVASLKDAKQAAARHAETLGFKVEIIAQFLDGLAIKAAENCVKKLYRNPKILTIWGGETTVQLPKNAGKGGRNQHLALAAAINMAGNQTMYLLAAGTDGSDGNTNATGAVVSGEMVASDLALGLNAKEYLSRADSNTYFKIVGGLIETGATGTNVMDLVLGIKL